MGPNTGQGFVIFQITVHCAYQLNLIVLHYFHHRRLISQHVDNLDESINQFQILMSEWKKLITLLLCFLTNKLRNFVHE